MSSGSGVWCKAVLLVAVGLVMFLVVVKAAEEQEQGLEKRATPTTLAQMAKILMDFQKRMKALESRRTTLLRGRDGRDGKPGKEGRDGKPGRDGRNFGLQGKPGKSGSPGLQGVAGPPGTKSGGVQYVRWGRTVCPSGSSRVYKGRIGGEHYTHKGGASNHVCLPEKPKYGRYTNGHQNAGYMYGTEYEVSGHNLFTKSNLHEHEAPCAVCYVQTRNAKMMVPATYACPAGWTREYRGYLMTEYYNHARSEFICVDQDAEAVPGTHTNLNGALLYPVEGRCGSLPCLPYVDGRELTCAVCTK